VEIAAQHLFLPGILKLIGRRRTFNIQSTIFNQLMVGLAMRDQKPYQIEIPDKLYFKIGEASAISGLPTHVLRFWESEFKKIKPRRTASGQRAYTRKDIETILEIKHLLHDRKFTLEGARKHLNARSESRELLEKRLLKDLKDELKSIRDMLEGN
jgi:DNA-binding transcriptional MerR regulator